MAAFGMSELVSAIKTVVILVKTGYNGISIAIFTICGRLKKRLLLQQPYEERQR